MILRIVGLAITPKARISGFDAQRIPVRCYGKPKSILRQSPILSHRDGRAHFHNHHWLTSLVNRRFQSFNSSPVGGTTNSGIVEDEDIKSFKVYVVNVDNKLGEPLSLVNALAARDKDEKGKFTEVLRQVQPASPSLIFPICKYISLKTLREKDLAQQKLERTEKAAKRQHKRLELNWTIGENDLAHRMERLKEFLSKGRHIEVTLGTQRKKGWQRRKPQNQESAEKLISKVKEVALGVKGAKESKAMTGDMSELVVLYFEGPRIAKEAALE